MNVPGHTLYQEGRGFYGPAGRCSCGATSQPLTSDAARKRWHADHKAEMRGPRAVPDQMLSQVLRNAEVPGERG